jgi:hypothetical protein
MYKCLGRTKVKCRHTHTHTLYNTCEPTLLIEEGTLIHCNRHEALLTLLGGYDGTETLKYVTPKAETLLTTLEL